MSEQAWVVVASGNGKVKHRRSSAKKLRPVCSSVGIRWREPAAPEVERLPTCPNCSSIEMRKLGWAIEHELRGAERRMEFAQRLRWVGNRRNDWWDGIGTFPRRFIDDEQERDFLDAIRQARLWLLHAADAIDPEGAPHDD